MRKIDPVGRATEAVRVAGKVRDRAVGRLQRGTGRLTNAIRDFMKPLSDAQRKKKR